MIYIKIAFLALIGAVIGWMTNKIAIVLIFRPVKPVKIPVLNFYMQGVLPKRRADIAESIGNIIENELLSLDDIFDEYITDSSIEDIKSSIIIRIINLLELKLPGVLFTSVRKPVYKYMTDFFKKDGDKIIRDFLRNTIEEAPKKIDLSKIVEEKINGFDIEYLEDIILSVVDSELKHIVQLGAVLGFFIGIVQGIIVLLL